MRIDFTVFGIPQPQGSTRAFVNRYTGRAAVTTDNNKLKPWRQEVAGMAADAMRKGGFQQTTGPMEVTCHFRFQKPKSVKKSVKHKTTKPDIDKLLRGVLDSITGIVFADDAQVVAVTCFKYFGDEPHARITVMEVTPAGQQPLPLGGGE